MTELTPRELEVARLVGECYTNFAIGVHLNITEGTVKVHIHHILAKLGIVNRTQLALRVMDLRIQGDPQIQELRG